MSLIFLSYSRKDLSAMRKVKRALQHAGASVWTDENLTPGTENWMRAIDGALEECVSVVVLLSPDSYDSEWVSSEVGKAKAYGKEIFPLLVRGDATDAVPLHLWNFQRIDLRKDFEAGCDKLVQAFDDRGWLEPSAQLPVSDTVTALAQKAKASIQDSTSKIMLSKNTLWAGIIVSVIILSGITFTLTSLLAGWPISFRNTETPTVTETLKSPTNTVLTATITPSNTPEPSPTHTGTARPTISPSPTLTQILTPQSIPTATIAPGAPLISQIDGSIYHYIPAGEFSMGSDVEQRLVVCEEFGYESKSEWFEDESPAHTVYLDAFWIGETEVTNARYQQCVEAGICADNSGGNYLYNDQYENYPVVYVDWNHAQTYCQWAGGRLPTEAEWEKAARGGLKGMRYPWGNENPVCELRADYGAQFVFCDDVAVGVRNFSSNNYGLYDVLGNVWEWVGDWYDDDYYISSPYRNPLGPEVGQFRVTRGGAWNTEFIHLNVADRDYNPPNRWFNTVGFRCVLTEQP